MLSVGGDSWHEGVIRAYRGHVVPQRYIDILHEGTDYHYLMQSPGELQITNSSLLCLSLQVDSQWCHLLSDQVQTFLSLKIIIIIKPLRITNLRMFFMKVKDYTILKLLI